MTKNRFLLCLAAAALTAGVMSLAACSGKAAAPAVTEAPAAASSADSTETEQETEQETAPDAALAAVVDDLYAAYPVDLMLLETRGVDLTDAEWASYNTGLPAAELEKADAAVVSESMTGSQAYSLVVLRAKNAADAPALAAAMLENADLAKWVCVQANTARAVAYDDVAVFAMADAELVDVNALLDAPDREFDFDLSRTVQE